MILDRRERPSAAKEAAEKDRMKNEFGARLIGRG
jgi:hypothetical protein